MSDFVAIQHTEKREMIFWTIDDKSFTRIVVGCLCVLERLTTISLQENMKKGYYLKTFLISSLKWVLIISRQIETNWPSSRNRINFLGLNLKFNKSKDEMAHFRIYD